MKYSNQREIIYKAVKNSTLHPTADMVYSEARKAVPNLSLATVYRNLAVLVETGMLQKVTSPGGADHYDATMSEHYHIICERCGKVFDVNADFNEVIKKIQEESGLVITSFNVSLRAVCGECLAAEKRY